jgi:hypothetical protein
MVAVFVMVKTSDGKAEWHFENFEECDESYHETTCHASITCKCGKKVWYGCGKKQTTRPIYCGECTYKELQKLKKNKSFELSDKLISDKTDQQIIMFFLRRPIPEHGNTKECIN